MTRGGWAMLAVAATLPVMTACFDRVNPFDPETTAVLAIDGDSSVAVGSETVLTLEWTPPGRQEPEWSYDPAGVVIFLEFPTPSAAGLGRVVARAIASGTVTIRAGFGNTTVTHTITVP